MSESKFTEVDPEKTAPTPTKEDFGATVWSQGVYYVVRLSALPQARFEACLVNWEGAPVPEPKWPSDPVRLQRAREQYATTVWNKAVELAAPSLEVAAAARKANPYDSTPEG